MRVIVVILPPLLGMPLQAKDGESLVIEVFTASDAPVSGTEVLERQGMRVVIYLVDDFARINRELSAGLPGNERHAMEVAQQRIRQHHTALARRYQHTAEGLHQAQTYRLERLPAVVFAQGEAVVLGVVDLEAALGIYQSWQRARRKPQ